MAAGQFLVLFSEAGWKIDGNRVFRMEPLIPNDGVFIISQPEPGAPLPPHLGRWHEDNISEITLSLAFTKIGLVPHGSSDASLGKGVIGIYFGPEPAALKVDEQLVVADQITKFLFEGTAIEQQFSHSNDATAESREENEWATRVEAWLRTSSHEPVAVQFRNSRGIQAKKKCLLAFLQQIVVAE